MKESRAVGSWLLVRRSRSLVVAWATAGVRANRWGDYGTAKKNLTTVVWSDLAITALRCITRP